MEKEKLGKGKRKDGKGGDDATWAALGSAEPGAIPAAALLPRSTA